jgi:2-dehydro-3-deoxy-D-arabinonate dehydratase
VKLAKYRTSSGQLGIGSIDDEYLILLAVDGTAYSTLADILEAENPRTLAESLIDPGSTPMSVSDISLLAPIDQQEIWAAGVTYTRSKAARMEESDVAASCYDRVYVSPRPELFLKATPHRVCGPGEPLRIRADSDWNVPEPELTLVLNSRLRLVGFTIGNDMSSRDIEGENPLYLPQAKVYDACCGIGPVIALPDEMPPYEATEIRLVVRRNRETAFEGTTQLSQMARSFDELIGWLGRDNSFPNGVLLMTGTGIVPDSGFSLLPGDVVDIGIDGIGTLSNPIVQNETPR